jgi:hypothetical protein
MDANRHEWFPLFSSIHSLSAAALQIHRFLGWTRRRPIHSWMVRPDHPYFPAKPNHFFTEHILNALFLNACGTNGSAVIVHSQETNSQLNDQYIWDYDAVLKTADGRDVVIQFNTMSASIYPIRNRILIPPENEPFVAKYIPGFERNIVIISDESAYGKRIIIGQDRAPVEKAAGQYAVSPTNPAFIKEYRAALQAFITKHRNDAEPDIIQDSERELNRLGQAQN